MRIVVLIGLVFSFLSGEVIIADEYRTIQRSTMVTTDNGAKHKVGDFGNYYALLIYVEKYKYLGNLKTPKKDVEAMASFTTP